MAKIITALYKCEHCNFESSKLREVEQHEAMCIHNPGNDKVKMQLIQDMYNSNSIEELNSLLIRFLTTYELDAVPELKKRMRAWSIENDVNNRYHISNYKLNGFYIQYYEILGLPSRIEDLPNLNKTVEELRKINKTSSEISKTFNKYRDSRIKELRSESEHYRDVKQALDDAVLAVEIATKKRNEIQKELHRADSAFDIQIAQEKNYVNPQIRANELRKILNIKG